MFQFDYWRVIWATQLRYNWFSVNYYSNLHKKQQPLT